MHCQLLLCFLKTATLQNVLSHRLHSADILHGALIFSTSFFPPPIVMLQNVLSHYNTGCIQKKIFQFSWFSPLSPSQLQLMAGKPAGAGDLSCEREAEGGATRVNPSRETAKGHQRHRDSLERLQRGKAERHPIDTWRESYFLVFNPVATTSWYGSSNSGEAGDGG